MNVKLVGIIAVVVALGVFLAYSYTNSSDQGWKYDSSAIADKSLIQQTNDFGFKFYSQISKNEDNLFFSPTSIDAVFALVYEGANGDTAWNMLDTFGFETDDAKRREQYRNVMNILNSGNSQYSLSTANALWVSDLYQLNSTYVDVAKKHYDSSVQNVDFVTDDGVNTINSWVDKTTNGKIKKLFELGSTDALTLVAITNTIYFKGEWLYPFTPGLTWDSKFYVSADETTTVEMMNRRMHPINHMQNDIVQMIELPYKGDRLSMLVMLPSEKNQIQKLESELSDANVSKWRSQMSETMAEVYLPRFSSETDYDLKELLTQMGMDLPFDVNKADLSNIADYPGIYIDEAVHKAAVEVNELGTEAAAATGAVAKLQSGPPVTFKADHPFVYVILDDDTGQILFMGRVMDPTK